MRLRGVKDLQSALDRLHKHLATVVIPDALDAAAKLVADEIKNNVPVDSGELKSTVVELPTGFKGDKAWVRVTVGKDGSGVAAVEFGAYKRNIKAHPFIRPSFESKKKEAAAIVLSAVKRAINNA